MGKSALNVALLKEGEEQLFLKDLEVLLSADWEKARSATLKSLM